MSFRVLSIDGGGMRGVYTATFLDALERSFIQKRNLPQGLDIGKAFQLIVGTSTGAIIGCGLAKGVSPAKIARLYTEKGSSIFSQKMPSKLGIDLLKQCKMRPRYLRKGDTALTSALQESFGATTISQIWDERGIALVVPAINMLNYRSWTFKTAHDPGSERRDDKYTLVDVCRASSAAPLYRSLAAITKPNDDCCYDVFCDGGLWANNPVLVALVEALKMVGDRDEEIELFCLGSCGKPEGALIDKKDVHRGLFEWKLGGEAACVSIAAQEYAFDMIAQFLLPHLKKKVKIIRFPAEKIPAAILKYLNLDETSEKGLRALKQQAINDASMINHEIQNNTPHGCMIKNLFNDMPPREMPREI